MAVFAVLLSGGSSHRMGSETNKSFIPLLGKPVIQYSLELFQSHALIESIVIPVHLDWRSELQELLRQRDFSKVRSLAVGGKERQDSVRNGLLALEPLQPKPDDIVLVHNACNPLISPELITQCVHAAQQFQASVAAHRVKDTVRRVDEKLQSLEVVPRQDLWLMQTPQCIQYQLFKQAHEKASRDGFHGTDDVQLVERLGVKPKIVECGYENIKITKPEDLIVAEAWLIRLNRPRP